MLLSAGKPSTDDSPSTADGLAGQDVGGKHLALHGAIGQHADRAMVGYLRTTGAQPRPRKKATGSSNFTEYPRPLLFRAILARTVASNGSDLTRSRQ